ncbi:MAG: FtsX-like permease family protein [Pseudomonadota bacterium]
MILWCLRVLLSQWWRRPGQGLTLVLGLALATALWSGVQAINAQARQSYDRAAEAIGGGGLDMLVDQSGLISTQAYVALRRAGWQVSPVVDGVLSVEGGRVRLIGIDVLTAPPGTGVASDMMGAPDQIFGGQARLFAAKDTAARLTGDLPPIQVTEAAAPGIVFADIAIALQLLERADGFDRLVIAPTSPRNMAALPPNLELNSDSDTQDLAALTDSFHLNLTAFGLLSFAVGLFIVNGAVGLAFEQRRAVVRTMRAHGLPLRTLVGALVIELSGIALIAGMVGIALGYGIAAMLLPDVAATLRGLYGATVEGSLTLRPAWWLGGLGMTAAGTALAATAALVTLARLPILAPARPRAWSMRAVSSNRWQAVAALGFFAISALAILLGSGLIAGFIMLGALLLGAALGLPFLLERLLSAATGFARTPLAEWFWADTRQQLPGLSLALMALLLALSANIGVGTMVSSFRATFTNWLDQRLASELYVRAEDAQQAGDLLMILQSRAEAVLPIWSADFDIAGRPGEVFSVADHPTYRDNWPMIAALPDVWDRVAAGDGALLNEQTARAADIWPGETLRIGQTDYVIAGVYSDYGNPAAQALITVQRFLIEFPQADRLNYGVRIAPDAVPALQEDLRALGLDDTQMVDQAALKTISLSVFERTFAVTGALNILTLGVAGFAILTALLTLAAMRLPQLAPVWALGLTRAQLGRLEVLRALVLAGLTALLAIPAGLALAWSLLAVINVEAFGWRLPMQVFPLQWLVLCGAAFVAAGLAAAWPARQLARMAPARLIGVFANAR